MKRTAVFRRIARAELMDAAAHYEGQKPGLGFELLDEIDRCVLLARQHPEAFPVVRNDIRRVVARRFPYIVYFKFDLKRIVVLAVLHTSRNPAEWQSRV